MKPPDSLTICYLLLYCFNSLALSLLGTTLLELQEQVHSTVAQISYVYASQSIGVAVGSAVGGPMFDRPYFQSSSSNAHLLLAFFVASVSVWTLATPYASTLWQLGVLTVGQGFMTGFARMGANCLLLRRNGKQSAPYMQSLHFLGGVGGWIAPMLTRYCLVYKERMLLITYATSAVALLPIIVWIIIQGWWFERSRRQQQTSTTNPTAAAATKPASSSSSSFPMYMVWLSLLLLLENGARTVLQGYIVPYGRKSSLHLDKSQSLLLNATYSGGFAVGRLGSIALSFILSPAQLLLCDVVGAAVASSILLFTPNASYMVLQACCALFGVSIASVFPTSILYANDAATSQDGQGQRLSAIMMAACVGSVLLPTIVGAGFDRGDEYGVQAMNWILFGSCAVGSMLCMSALLDRKALPMSVLTIVLSVFKTTATAATSNHSTSTTATTTGSKSKHT